MGSGVASGSTTLVATRGDVPLSDGPHHFTARQQASGMLLSADSMATVVTVDTAPPTATVHAANVTTAGNTEYFFNVTYTDATAIDASTLHDANILVMGPNGYSQTATFVTADNPGNGSPRTVTYEIRPPNDEWTAGDNGTYVLLESTNVALPLTNWIPVLTNTFDGSGDLNLSTNIVNPNYSQQFYILSQ